MWLTLNPLAAELRDLEKYTAEPVDGGVVAWPVDRSDPNRAKDKTDITFKVKAQVLAKDPAADGTITASTQSPTQTETEGSDMTDPEQTQSTGKDEL